MQVIFAALVSFIAGLGLLLYGYRMKKFLLPVWGFIAGFWLGANLTAQILGTGFLATVTGWIAGLAAGSGLALLSHHLHDLRYGIISAVIGYAVGSGVLTAVGLGPGIFSILAGLALALAVVGLYFRLNVKRIVAMAMTSVAGANAILLAFLLITGRVQLASLESTGNPVQPVLHDSWFWPVVWLALALIGFIYQDRADRTVHVTRGSYTSG